MHYFDVILLRDVIWAFEPKVTRQLHIVKNDICSKVVITCEGTESQQQTYRSPIWNEDFLF